MAISDKLTYLNTTKSQLKDMINYGLDDNNKITNSTTFRNYVTSIFNAFLEALRTPDTLFTNLPKKSGTGANITLNDTANAPMRITLSPSELSQDGTPTPSSPQDIHTISGSNKIVVNGKNLLPTNKELWESGHYDYQGNKSAFATRMRTINLIPVLPNTTYYCQSTNNKEFFIREFDKTKTFTYNAGAVVGTFTTKSNTYYIGYSVDITYSDYVEDTNKIAVFYNSTTDKTWVPYTSQEQEIDLGDIECGSINNYENKFIRSNDGTWQLEKNIGKVVLDGSETWGNFKVETTSGLGRAISTLSDVKLNATKTMYMSDKLQSANFAGSWDLTYDNVAVVSNAHQIIVYLQNITTLADFQNWIETNTPKLYYVLDTPTYTQITGTLAEQLEYIREKMMSQAGQTNISQINNDLAFEMSASAIEEL